MGEEEEEREKVSDGITRGSLCVSVEGKIEIQPPQK